MQATVAGFDETTRSGHVLTDDGMPIDFPAHSLADHIRHLRVGQRVFVELDGDAVVGIAIWPTH
ncbi:MAG: cold-shock protein [Aeromicrobium sp.]|nr:cold-shock protein [Aeromicrobium sp.]